MVKISKPEGAGRPTNFAPNPSRARAHRGLLSSPLLRSTPPSPSHRRSLAAGAMWSPWVRRGRATGRLTQSPSFSPSCVASPPSSGGGGGGGKADHQGIGSVLDDDDAAPAPPAPGSRNVLHRVRSSTKLRACKSFAVAAEAAAAAVAGERRVVLYFTSSAPCGARSRTAATCAPSCGGSASPSTSGTCPWTPPTSPSSARSCAGPAGAAAAVRRGPPRGRRRRGAPPPRERELHRVVAGAARAAATPCASCGGRVRALRHVRRQPPAVQREDRRLPRLHGVQRERPRPVRRLLLRRLTRGARS